MIKIPEPVIAMVALLCGYLSYKLSRVLAGAITVGILLLFGLKEFGYISADYNDWVDYYRSVNDRLNIDALGEKSWNWLNATTPWMQRGFVGGFMFGAIY